MSGAAAGLARFYDRRLAGSILPFWERAVDSRRGGVFTCFDNAGARRLSGDKYTWSQGRFVWLMSRLSDLCARGIASAGSGLHRDPAAAYRGYAERTVEFLLAHAFLEDGSCAFLLSEEGARLEPVPGGGYDTSVFADCFLAIGFAEFARAFRDRAVLETAARVYASIKARVASGAFRSDPYPIPAGHRYHSIPMILLHLSRQLEGAMRALGDPRAGGAAADCGAFLEEVMRGFRGPDGTVAEILAPGGAEDTLLARHVNPGHTIECMWFAIEGADLAGRPELVGEAALSVERAFELGWDRERGGLLHYVDPAGGPPSGRKLGDPLEDNIAGTWDMKLWWPHSEALYSTLLAYARTGRPAFLDLYRRVHEYAFGVFPNPDASIGEWIQIRDRGGRPVEKVVALPVKDPYHIMRNFMLILELLEGGATVRDEDASLLPALGAD